MDLSEVIVIIPALNEEQALPQVIRDLKARGLNQIRVVDNGSSDRTAEVASLAGAEVLFEARRGYGQACWTGYQELPEHVKWVLFCDADGSDAMEDLPLLLAEAEEHEFVLGNRRASIEGRRVMTPVQNFGNGLATTLIRWGWGFAYQDLGPMRLIRREALLKLGMKDRGFGWTVEMQVRAVEEGLRIKEVAVGYHPRQGGRSKISGTLRGSFQAGSIILSTLGVLYFKKMTDTFEVKKVCPVLGGILILLGAWWMSGQGEFNKPGVVPVFLQGAGLMGLGLMLSWSVRSMSLVWFWLVAVLARLLLLPMVPGDDIWRYLWEGAIQNQGYNPYLLAPASELLEGLRTDWWSWINHREITAIYPPLTQLGFRILAWIAPTVLVFKLAFIAADLVVCWLLQRRFGRGAGLIYAWNPLVLYSFAGGGHYDSWMILAVTCAWLLWERQDGKGVGLFLVAGLMGCGVALKYVCAPLLAWMLWEAGRKWGWRKSGGMALVSTLPFLIAALMLPGLGEMSWKEWIPRDFAQYARSAEFVPHYLEGVWEESKRMNQIFLPVVLVLVLWRLWRSRSLAYFAEEFWLLLLLLSPIIHAWYFTWALPFAVATRNLGWRLVSVSGFVYFMLQDRVARGDLSWKLTELERLVLWLPLILGFVGWRYLRRKSTEAEL
ncbi:MAG: glycosyltransferase [Blastochloris sp.]|nr:glycosyltransferase [Blastochloris sp.]